MARIALCVEYEGTHYHGWQIQKKQISIQATLEKALSKIALHPVHVVACGRTDAGVHAVGQIIHFDVAVERPYDAWVRGVNSFLPKDIRVKWARSVDDSFHARYSALSRQYTYLIYIDKISPGLLHSGVTWAHYEVSVDKMKLASEALIGTHDFSSFRASSCQAKTPVREIKYLEIRRQGSMITIDIEANAFLHHMVRNIVGTLLYIGRGSEHVNFAKQVLDARNRSFAPQMAPASGLYLRHAAYPESYDFPKMKGRPWFLSLE